MRIAYFDCFSGVSGNMLLAAVLDAGVSTAWLRSVVKKVAPSARLVVKEDRRHGMRGVHVRVDYPHQGQPHRHLGDIKKIIAHSGLPESVRERSIAVFGRLAEAEAAVHGAPLEHVHFHEVGAVDAIVDVVGTVAGLDRLGVGAAVCSVLPMSGGEVECAHGTLPVPAPATLELLLRRGAPVRGTPIAAELVTPTGAALVTTLAGDFGPMPAMTVTGVGVGLGDRELPERPNLMRLILGERFAGDDTVIQLEAAIDDMPAEHFDFLLDRLHAAGALEVLLVPAQMKKNRPGTLVRVLVASCSQNRVQTELFNHSTTLGVRSFEVSRAVLPRKIETVDTAHGKVRVKVADRPDGSERVHVEYDDLQQAALVSGKGMERIEAEVLAAWRKKRGKR
jgi:pyridinium-3,5-bisthiocarboxylic acid mononucleotide nickel chelatase